MLLLRPFFLVGGGGEVYTLIEGDWIWGAGVGYGKVLGRLACCGGDL